MADNKQTIGGFEAIIGALTKTDVDIPKVDNDNDDVDNDDDDVAKANDDDDTEPPVKTKPTNVDDDDDDSDDEPTKVDEPASDDDTTDLSEAEPEISEYFANTLVEKLGITFEDKDKKFESVDDVIDLMTEIVKANSRPEYANEEVAKFDEYVRNGGDLKTFYDQVYKDSVDIDKLDIEEEDDQRKIVETNLKNLGWKEEKIQKAIKRYSDAETLRDEAEDALEQVKEYQDKKAKKLLADQEKAKIAAEEQKQKFTDDVITYINNLKDISGVSLDGTAKKEIIDYIFRASPDGQTGFQKAYSANAVKNLVETAYFIHPKYRESLLSKTSKKATDDAMRKVRDKLKQSKGKKNTGNNPNLGKATHNFSSLSGLIIK